MLKVIFVFELFVATVALKGFCSAQPIALQKERGNVADSRQFDDGEYQLILKKTSAIHGQIEIYTKQETEFQQRRVRVEFTKKNGGEDDIHHSDAIVLTNDKNVGNLAFNSFIDEQTGLWCLYDTVGENFVILIALPDDSRHSKYDLWHPGVRGIGWGRGLWVKYYRKVRESHDELPYDNLPSELEIVDAG